MFSTCAIWHSRCAHHKKRRSNCPFSSMQFLIQPDLDQMKTISFHKHQMATMTVRSYEQFYNKCCKIKNEYFPSTNDLQFHRFDFKFTPTFKASDVLLLSKESVTHFGNCRKCIGNRSVRVWVFYDCPMRAMQFWNINGIPCTGGPHYNPH